MEARKVSKSYIPKAGESEREIYHVSDGILLPEAFARAICFYYALLREEDGSGSGAEGDG